MPRQSPIDVPQPTHEWVLAEAKVGAVPYKAWRAVASDEWRSSTPEQRAGWRAEARESLLNAIRVAKGSAAAASAEVTY